MCFFKAPKITTQSITPNVMQALPANAVAPTPEAPVFGVDDSEGEQSKASETTGKKSGISSLKINKAPTNVAGANLQLIKTTGVKT